jgi:ParB family chromosome partitioning protein
MSKRKLLFANNPLLSGPALGERERSGIPYREIPLELIDRDPNQPRIDFDEDKLKELALSIKTYGVLSPILVRPSNSPGRFDLIAGERRLRAAKIVGLRDIPALIDKGIEDGEGRTLAMQLVENLQRADLSSLERSHAIGALRDNYKLSVRDIGEKLGISKSQVQRSLDILSLPDDLLSALKQGASESKVLLLAKIEDEEVRASYLKDLDSLTRTELQRNLEKEQTRGGTTSKNPEDIRIAEELQRSLGLRVRITRTNPESQGGKLVVDFYSEDDLKDVYRRLAQDA